MHITKMKTIVLLWKYSYWLMDYGITGTEKSPSSSMDLGYWWIISARAVLTFLLIPLHVRALSKTSCLFLKPEFAF